MCCLMPDKMLHMLREIVCSGLKRRICCMQSTGFCGLKYCLCCMQSSPCLGHLDLFQWDINASTALWTMNARAEGRQRVPLRPWPGGDMYLTWSAGICGAVPAGLSVDGIRANSNMLQQLRIVHDVPNTADVELYLPSLSTACPGRPWGTLGPDCLTDLHLYLTLPSTACPGRPRSCTVQPACRTRGCT